MLAGRPTAHREEALRPSGSRSRHLRRSQMLCHASTQDLASERGRRRSESRVTRAPVAQWIEHQTSDLRVGGSNPPRRASRQQRRTVRKARSHKNRFVKPGRSVHEGRDGERLGVVPSRLIGTLLVGHCWRSISHRSWVRAPPHAQRYAAGALLAATETLVPLRAGRQRAWRLQRRCRGSVILLRVHMPTGGGRACHLSGRSRSSARVPSASPARTTGCCPNRPAIR